MAPVRNAQLVAPAAYPVVAHAIATNTELVAIRDSPTEGCEKGAGAMLQTAVFYRGKGGVAPSENGSFFGCDFAQLAAQRSNWLPSASSRCRCIRRVARIRTGITPRGGDFGPTNPDRSNHEAWPLFGSHNRRTTRLRRRLTLRLAPSLAPVALSR